MARSNKVNHSKVTAKGKYALGTPEEIHQRAVTGYQPEPTDFAQIGTAGSGRSLADPPKDKAASYFKFDHSV